MMLLHAGCTVPVGQLAEAVWDTEQPHNPRRAVQLHITRLRKMLASMTGGDVIVTGADGYRVDVRPDQIDLGRFQRRLERAEQAAKREDLDGEARALAEALAQWRGEPLAGIPSELLEREVVPRLREQWLQTVERRVEVELRRGRYAELIGELRVLTAQYPLRESLWALLMRALFGSGRRADALDAYHTVRRRLADELGIEPGEELQTIHGLVLMGRSQSADEGPALLPPVPRQLPLDVSGFVGRAVELASLDELLADHPGSPAALTVGVIAGIAGVGKTTLAVHWARRVADHFPDGQLWVSLRCHDPSTAVSPDRALTSFLRALGVPEAGVPADADDRASLYRSLMDGRRMLIILDDVVSPQQARPLLPGAPGSLVLITSRNQLSGLVAAEAAHPLVLDPLTRDEAHELLVARLGADRISAEPAAAAEIVRHCAGLPLALTIAASSLAANPRRGLPDLATEVTTRRCTRQPAASNSQAGGEALTGSSTTKHGPAHVSQHKIMDDLPAPRNKPSSGGFLV